jgi:hypothetical protein
MTAGDSPAPCAKALPAGPGTELKKLLAELGLKPSAGCKCAAKARQMDKLGVSGCRERLEEITGWLREARGQASWLETIQAAAAVLTSGLKIDPFDVEGSLVRLAIARAEKSA